MPARLVSFLSVAARAGLVNEIFKSAKLKNYLSYPNHLNR